MAGNGLAGYGIPFIINTPKSREEKIEEARNSGLIGNSPKDIKDVPQNEQRIRCQYCGSLNVSVGFPETDDLEKGAKIPYVCIDCGYEGVRFARIKGFKKIPGSENSRVIVDLIPDSLLGITGSALNGTENY